MTGFLEFIDDRGGDWVLWTPEVAAREPELRDAVDRFSSLEIPAGEAATRWLREEALNNHPSTVTWLHAREGRIEGFFAMCSSHAKFSQRHRKRLLRRGVGLHPQREVHELHPIQPVALIAWLAKAKDSDLTGVSCCSKPRQPRSRWWRWQAKDR